MTHELSGGGGTAPLNCDGNPIVEGDGVLTLAEFKTSPTTQDPGFIWASPGLGEGDVGCPTPLVSAECVPAELNILPLVLGSNGTGGSQVQWGLPERRPMVFAAIIDTSEIFPNDADVFVYTGAAGEVQLHVVIGTCGHNDIWIKNASLTTFTVASDAPVDGSLSFPVISEESWHIVYDANLNLWYRI